MYQDNNYDICIYTTSIPYQYKYLVYFNSFPYFYDLNIVYYMSLFIIDNDHEHMKIRQSMLCLNKN